MSAADSFAACAVVTPERAISTTSGRDGVGAGDLKRRVNCRAIGRFH